MPKRTDSPAPKRMVKEGNKYKHLVDLGFLPREIIDRVDTIFDSYFNLGMKQRSDVMDQEIPIFPSKVSSLDSPSLGDTLGRYTAWHSYAADKHKYVLVAVNHLESEMGKIVDKELGSQVADKGNIEAKKSKARNSDEYITMLSYAQKLRGLKTLLDRELDNFDRCISSLSREISRREHHGGF